VKVYGPNGVRDGVMSLLVAKNGASGRLIVDQWIELHHGATDINQWIENAPRGVWDRSNGSGCTIGDLSSISGSSCATRRLT
jgi:hypothetical protein